MVTSASRLPAEYSERLFSDGLIDGIRVRSVRVHYSNYMSYGRRILSFATFMLGATWLVATAGRHDVVFATSTPLTVGIPGWLGAALNRTPFVFEVRDLWPEAAIQMGAISEKGFFGRIAKVLERFLYRRARHVVALSPGMVAGVVAEGKDPALVHMVPNSADLDLFSPGPKDTELVERYGLTDRFVVGYAGAIGPSNAVENNVPEAARVLSEHGRTDIVFLIVGEGKSLPELQKRCEGMPNVIVTGSTIPKAEVPRFTRTADALMVLFDDKPILATNSPNKFFDGLATGRPMIVNSNGWTKDLVEDNGCGVYFPAGDGAALAEAVIRLADDTAMRQEMGRRARALAEERFARDILAEQVLRVLETAADAR